ncbi:MAG: FRG domain-containing protein [Acidimicrobiia bacterium]|nr:FRG domain-containing protein [Acidimicrobiia bacterium]MYB73417.1 FRG domain-containing protein [Acidimicrobiia bacterium]MYH98409.1 FRG domain-containing protein [Acidimicrobiia bacterium]
MFSGSLSGVRWIDVEHVIDARRVRVVTTQQPPTGNLLSKYLHQLFGDEGESDDARSFAYRGQRDATWELQSSAYRRLSRSTGLGASSGREVTEGSLIDYNKELISRFRNRRFDTADGARFTDLEALSQLQHLGAATALIDFSLNPLVALWFACQDAPHDPIAPEASQQDGAVFRVDTTYSLDSDPGRLDDGAGPNLDEILGQRLIPPHDLLAWRPPAVASARERVVAQHSVLLLGRPLMASNPSDSRIRKIPVSRDDKERLRGELAAIGIDASSLFPDLHGFATTNGVEHPVIQVSAKDLLAQGVSAYNRGDAVGARDALAPYVNKRPDDWVARLLLSNAYVDLRMYGEALGILDAAVEHIDALHSWQHHTVYTNRANTRAAMGDHENALADYEHALGLSSGGIKGTLHFNRGNSYFALGRYADALADFEACAGSALAAYNAGNTCVALGRLDTAQARFTEAQNEPRISTNSLGNLKVVQEIMSLIGADQCEVELQSSLIPIDPRIRQFVIRSNQITDRQFLFPLAGNVGNQGNTGWIAVGEWSAVGGQGFSGSDGMTVVVTGSTAG